MGTTAQAPELDRIADGPLAPHLTKEHTVLPHPLLSSELARGRLDDLRRDGAQAPVESRELAPARRRLRLGAGLSLPTLRPRRLRTHPRG